MRFKPAMIGLMTLAVLTAWVMTHKSNEQADQTRPSSPGGPLRSWHASLVQRAVADGEQGLLELPIAAFKGSTDHMPKKIRRLSKATLGDGHSALGLRFDGAQYLPTELGIGVWVVMGRGVTCMLHERGILATCNTTKAVAREGLLLVAGRARRLEARPTRPTEFLVLGIAPSGVRRVHLRALDGATKVVSVAGNTFALRTNAPVKLETLEP